MAQTLEQLRTALALAVSRLFSGTATGGTTTTLIDTSGLQRYTETDTLAGAYLYIEDTTDDLAPEGESRRIESYNASTQTITVDRAFSAAPESDDTYEIYLAPLTLDQWDGCINDAIKGAWPELFTPATEDVTPDGSDSHNLSANADRVLGAEITFSGSYAGYPAQPLLQWYTTGDPGSLVLKLSRPVPSTDRTIRVLTGQKFDALAAGESTSLDPQYVIDAARVQFYQRMADASRQSDQGSFLRLMAHWQEKAAERKAALTAAQMGYQQPPPKEKK